MSWDLEEVFALAPCDRKSAGRTGDRRPRTTFLLRTRSCLVALGATRPGLRAHDSERPAGFYASDCQRSAEALGRLADPQHGRHNAAGEPGHRSAAFWRGVPRARRRV